MRGRRAARPAQVFMRGTPSPGIREGLEWVSRVVRWRAGGALRAGK